MNNPKKLYGLILAGGFSRRMGQDKSCIDYHGKPQVEYVADLLRSYCDQVFLSKRKDQQAHSTIPYINDDEAFASQGPLGGILSAMKAYPQQSWLVMACDLPFITSETLEFLLQYRNVSKIATAFQSAHDGLPEPLCAVWEAAGYEKILGFFNQGIHCPRKVLIKSDVTLLNQGNPRWLDNVNNTAELQEALRIIKAGKP